MSILAFDIGGTYVKYGVWDNDCIKGANKFSTPDTWELLKEKIKKVKESFENDYQLEGVAFSVPGSPNDQTEQIEGESLVEYLHYFPIYDQLSSSLQLEVSFENDANCAALAELWKGNAKGCESALVVVVGTGIGGALIVHDHLVRGFNNYAGEFGFMLLNDEENFGQLATAVGMAERYNSHNKEMKSIDAIEVFKRADQGDLIAQEKVDDFFYYLSIGLYNLNTIFNPEKILIGGGVSQLEGFIEKIETQTDKLAERIYTNPYRPFLQTCKFNNDANLIGAVYNFLN